MSLIPENIRTMIDWLGEIGASAGLERSHMNVEELRQLGEKMGIVAPSKITRKELISLIMTKASQRIDRSVSELLKMDSNELMNYFERVRPNKAELLSVLNELDFHPGSEAQKSLYKYAARQIAETGMFQRVAMNDQSETPTSESK